MQVPGGRSPSLGGFRGSDCGSSRRASGAQGYGQLHRHHPTPHHVPVLHVLVSVIFTILIGTAFRTLRQIREIRARSRSQKLEEEIREMKEKASMLQTRPASGSTTTPVSASLADIAPPIEPSPPPPPPKP